MRALAATFGLALLVALPTVVHAAGGMDDDDEAATFNDVLLFAEVYDYAFGGPATSLGLTCAGTMGTADPLDGKERSALNALYGAPTPDWQGFVPLSECTALRAGANPDGPGFTELVNTGTPEAFAGREGVYLFTMTRFCGIGCGSVDHMTVIEEADGYRPIWGIPRIDASGEIVFDNIEEKP